MAPESPSVSIDFSVPARGSVMAAWEVEISVHAICHLSDQVKWFLMPLVRM